MIRVLLVDDQALLREGMRTLLSLEPDLTVVGTAGNGQDGAALAEQLRPDVVLMDIRMPVCNGVDGTRLVRAAAPETKVLILTTFDDDASVLDALREGAVGYLLKDMPPEEIASAIRTVVTGGAVMPPGIAAKVVAALGRAQTPTGPPPEVQARLAELTHREREILSLLGLGLSNKELAEKLWITEGTAKNHVSNLMEKLTLRDRTQAALFAARWQV